jgi:DNA/RNA endonuclease YhcR with UshA esterase domain
MKNSCIRLSAIALFILISSLTYAQKVITVDEAKNHIDETVIIKGEVSQVTISKSGVVYFNMGGKFPDNKFSAVIMKRNVSKFDNAKDYEGKIVEIKGYVKEYKGKPEILLEEKDQLKLAPKEEVKK